MTELNQLPPPPKRPSYTKEQVDCYLEAIKELHGKMTVEILEKQLLKRSCVELPREKQHPVIPGILKCVRLRTT